MRRLLQKQMQSLQGARALAQAIRSYIPQSGLDPTYNQVAPQIVIQQSGFERPSPIVPTAVVQSTVPGQKDPIAEELKRLDADVKHGLLDKTGDGANANIIKLGEQLKRVAEGIKNISGGGSRAGTREIQYDDERLSAIRMQGERYIPGMRESLGLGKRGAFSGLKNLFSLSPLKDFKMEDIDEQSLFGGAIKRKMAESQYAADQLAMAKTLKGDIRADVRKKKEYQDEEGQFSEKIFRQRKIEQFREQNRLRGEIGKTVEEIDRLKHDEGYTDEQIKKTGLYKTLQQQERELSAADPDRFARDIKEAKKKDIESQQANIKTAPLAASVKSNDVAPDVSGMDVSEKESEQILVVSQQIELLKQIEENTRPLKGLESILKSAMGATGGGSGGGDDDGGGFDLGGLGAKGARAALPYALPAAIAYGAARTIDYGASALGVGDVEIDEAQDEANWQKMSTGQKIGSGIARGIESVGSFLGLESFAKEAEASRIEKETQIVGKQTQAVGVSEQTIQTDIKFNESTFAENDPENYKKFIEFKESRTSELAKEYIESGRYGKSRESRRLARTMAERRARDEAIIKFKNEIEAADAGSIEQTKTISDSDIEAAPVTVNGKQVGTIGDEGLVAKPGQEQALKGAQDKTRAMVSADSIQPAEKLSSKEEYIADYINKRKGSIERQKLSSESEKRQQLRDLKDRAEMSWHGELKRREAEQVAAESIEPPQDLGGKVYQESDQLRSIEKTVIQQSAPNIINAPTTNVNQTTNNVTRPPARNTDSTYREYSKSRFSW